MDQTAQRTSGELRTRLNTVRNMLRGQANRIGEIRMAIGRCEPLPADQGTVAVPPIAASSASSIVMQIEGIANEIGSDLEIIEKSL
jgi:hypothetical protein